MKYVIGIGNYAMGDDGIGLRLVEAMAERGLGEGFELVEIAHDALRLLEYFTPDTEQILLIDCVTGGARPGEHRFFTPAEVETRKDLSGFTTHEGDVLQALTLAWGLAQPVPPLTILGIEPERMAPEPGLSPALELRFEEYVAAVLDHIRRGTAPG